MLLFESARLITERREHPGPPADLASIGMHVTREVTLPKSPERELEEFLASKPAWMQRVLQQDFSSFSRDEHLEWINNQDRVLELIPECERLLRQLPAKWQEYRKRQMQNSQPLIQMLVSRGKPGRPSKTALAEEAANLRRAGMNHPQIASELNKRHGADAKNATTAEAVRKLLKRHPDKS